MRQLGQFKCLAAGVILSCASLTASAQEQEGISIGQLKLLPTIGLTWGRDDNVTFSNDQQVQVSSDFFVISPGIRLEAPTDDSIFTLTWQGEFGRYDSSSTDDYEDWSLRGSWDYDPTSRTSLGLFGEYREAHDRRGEGRTQGDLGLEQFEPDEYELFSFGGYFAYGAVGSRGRIEIEALRTERDYQNNRDQTRLLDRDDDHLEGTFFWRIRPKTSLLVGIAYSDIDYRFTQVGDPSLDSEENRFYVGVTWDVSARTTGRIDYGWLEKEFDDPLRENYDSDFWRASISWQPRTYSTFNLTASRETNEADGFGDYVLSELVSLDWTHYWSTRFNTIVEYGIGTDDHRPDFREDDLTSWGVEGRWQINRYFQLGLGYNDYERDSNDGEFTYDRGVWMLTFEASF